MHYHPVEQEEVMLCTGLRYSSHFVDDSGETVGCNRAVVFAKAEKASFKPRQNLVGSRIVDREVDNRVRLNYFGERTSLDQSF